MQNKAQKYLCRRCFTCPFSPTLYPFSPDLCSVWTTSMGSLTSNFQEGSAHGEPWRRMSRGRKMHLARVFIPLAPSLSGPHRPCPLTKGHSSSQIAPVPPLSPTGFQELLCLCPFRPKDGDSPAVSNPRAPS